MGRAPKAAKTPASATDPAVQKRSELKKLALSTKILSDTASKPQAQLGPSKTVLKHHGKDIIKKSQRKNRYLFSFPGLIAPTTGGKIGELKDLGTKNPILYLDFPQGQMKLFGTILYPKNRYLTLQFSRGGKNVMCEDYFDNMIVFSDAWWIGTKEDNPEEARIDFPKEMIQEQHAEFDFQAGAGGISIHKPVVNTTKRKEPEEDSLETELEEDTLDAEEKLKEPMELTPVRHSERNSGKRHSHSISQAIALDAEEKLKEPIELTPVRHSERNSGKRYKFREASSDDDDDPNPSDVAHDGQETEDGSCPDGTDEGHTLMKPNKQRATNVTKSKEASKTNNVSLVQTTISALFKKAGGKNVQKKLKKSPAKKGSGKKQGYTGSKRKINQVEDSNGEDEPFLISSEDDDGSDEAGAA